MKRQSVSVSTDPNGNLDNNCDYGRAAAPSDEDAAVARASLEATIACLDQLGLDQIAAHASLALERLNEAFPPSGDRPEAAMQAQQT